MKKITAVVTAFFAMLLFSFGCFAEPTGISAVSAILINADTGEIIYEKNAHEKRAMASTTKIMTALLTLESGQLDKRFTVDDMAIKVEGTSMGLREGDIVTRRALCYGMLLPSGNDAANAAAVNISGSMSAFAEKMNEKAAELGMENTNFVTPSGLDADGHYSTAYDMALLTSYALKNSEFKKICGSSSAALEYGNPPYRRTLYNSNKLLSQYSGCIGVKTGFTDNARRCLVSAAERDGITLIAVTLNAPDDWSDHAEMFDYGFSLLTPYEVMPDSFAIPVIGGEAEKITAVPEKSKLIGIMDGESDNITVEYYVPEFIYADIEKGDKLGLAKIYYNNTEITSIPLVADSGCKRVTAEPDMLSSFLDNFGINQRT